MPQSSVLIKNATINICHADPGRTVYLPRLQANFQKEKRESQALSPILRGRGKTENDRPYLYRVRIDLPPQDLLPVINDLVFVARHTTNPHLRGWYSIWDDPEPTAGDLPTYILYLHKEQ
jgi:hypothetical protein